MGERFLIVSFFSSLSRSYCTVGQKTKSWSHLGALELNQGNEPGKGRDTMSLNTGELVDPINILFLSLFSPPYRLYQSQISMRADELAQPGHGWHHGLESSSLRGPARTVGCLAASLAPTVQPPPLVMAIENIA